MSSAINGAKALSVEITSDILCPFCLLGVKNFQSAITKYNDLHPTTPLRPEITMKPFQLNPALTDEPQNKQAVMIKKFGEERAKSAKEMFRGRFQALGYDPVDNGQTSSSHRAQRLQTYTGLKKPSELLPMTMKMFENYHIKGIAPSDAETLSEVGVEYGVFGDVEEGKEWLQGDECEKETRSGYLEAKRKGISGVPFFVFGGKYGSSGALPVEEFVEVLEEVVKQV